MKKQSKKPTTIEGHKLAIAKQTLAMPDEIAGVMGGPTKAEARETLKASIPLWKVEHPKAAIPSSIYKHTGVVDVSWHNDAMPSFTFEGNERSYPKNFDDEKESERLKDLDLDLEVKLWADYPKEKSEFSNWVSDDPTEQFTRYHVSIFNWSNGIDAETYRGNDPKAAVDALLALKIPVAIAQAFAKELRLVLNDEQWSEMRKRNADNDDENVCASHDFVDANMVMESAFEKVTNRTDFDADNDADCALWNSAWRIAKKFFLSA